MFWKNNKSYKQKKQRLSSKLESFARKIVIWKEGKNLTFVKMY